MRQPFEKLQDGYVTCRSRVSTWYGCLVCNDVWWLVRFNGYALYHVYKDQTRGALCKAKE